MVPFKLIPCQRISVTLSEAQVTPVAVQQLVCSAFQILGRAVGIPNASAKMIKLWQSSDKIIPLTSDVNITMLNICSIVLLLNFKPNYNQIIGWKLGYSIRAPSVTFSTFKELVICMLENLYENGPREVEFTWID